MKVNRHLVPSEIPAGKDSPDGAAIAESSDVAPEWVVVKFQDDRQKRVRVGTRVGDDPELAPFAGKIKVDGFEPTLVLFSNHQFSPGDSYTIVEGM
ncbi:hypothetical protein KFL_000680280 [Klebsormidium nitens]|uniref:Uncharacterized protein n=1 Tax=Klebsormidium nitens TaxID=105231 RepID=A0A0U9HS47_KLENI|nr:hypothetical protein KFL_000680280 [Klebsormidium nitens]|eukprot:GAQ81011.1 hypothetical protein KFL_000680280 [Klebsormidium nitens]